MEERVKIGRQDKSGLVQTCKYKCCHQGAAEPIFCPTEEVKVLKKKKEETQPKVVKGFSRAGKRPQRRGRGVEMQTSRTSALTCSFIVVHGDAVQLQVAITVIGSSGVNAMFITYYLPELPKKSKETSKALLPAN